MRSYSEALRNGTGWRFLDETARSGSGDFWRLLLAQAVAAELQAMSVMDDAVEDGVGEGRFADQIVPAVDRDLAGDQRGAAAVAVLDDLQQVVTLLGTERLKTPVVEDQELDAAEGTHQARVTAVAARQCEIGEQTRNALVKHRTIITAGLVAEGTSKPTFADPGRPFDDQVLRLVDPAAGNQGLEQGSVETAGGTVIDVLDRRLVAQPGIAQPGPQASFIAFGRFTIEEQAEPFGVRQAGACRIGLQLGKGPRHAGEAQLVQLVEGRMHQQCQSPSQLVVVAGAADVGVIEQQLALRRRLRWWPPVEPVLED